MEGSEDLDWLEYLGQVLKISCATGCRYTKFDKRMICIILIVSVVSLKLFAVGQKLGWSIKI